MTRAAKAGLLPFYLKLYDEVLPERRAGFDVFLDRVAAGLAEQGLAVVRAPVCRVKSEFESAIAALERDGADALVTVHLAYSPSLESIDAVCASRLPVVILDTTMDASFGPATPPDRIMYNHGVHGVMDFANLLRRRGRPFEIVAGHAGDAGLYARAAGRVRAALAARTLRATRALRIGPAFAGMGDFAVEPDVLAARLGIRAEQAGLDALDRAIGQVGADDVAREVAEDRARFECALPDETHARSVRVGLGLRRLIAEGGYGACSVNFQAFDRQDRPADTMPFLELSKGMARGIGYGGEGDVLTAALVGALGRAFGSTTFTEIFCPDWAGDSLFLSHMGEISPSVAAGRPRVFEKPFIFGGGRNPAVLTCAVRQGPAVFVNLAPGPRDGFALLVTPVDVLGDATHPGLRDSVRIWVRPRGLRVPAFLEAYSRHGGTHHSALVLDAAAEDIAAFGRLAGLAVERVGV